MERLPADKDEAFPSWLRKQAEAAGYRLDSPRAGGLSQLAADSGLSLSVVSRALSGERMPDLRTLRALSRPLRTNLRELLLRSGQADEADLPASTTVGIGARLSAAERDVALRELGAIEERLTEAHMELAREERELDMARTRVIYLEERVTAARQNVLAITADVARLRRDLDSR
jgi:transcriptional regulator with XRE-family HTH domain